MSSVPSPPEVPSSPPTTQTSSNNTTPKMDGVEKSPASDGKKSVFRPAGFPEEYTFQRGDWLCPSPGCEGVVTAGRLYRYCQNCGRHQPYKNLLMAIAQDSHFRTLPCTDQQCTGRDCHKAHGPGELRDYWKARKVRMSNDPPPVIPAPTDQEIGEFVQRWGLERTSARDILRSLSTHAADKLIRTFHVPQTVQEPFEALQRAAIELAKPQTYGIVTSSQMHSALLSLMRQTQPVGIACSRRGHLAVCQDRDTLLFELRNWEQEQLGLLAVALSFPGVGVVHSQDDRVQLGLHFPKKYVNLFERIRQVDRPGDCIYRSDDEWHRVTVRAQAARVDAMAAAAAHAATLGYGPPPPLSGLKAEGPPLLAPRPREAPNESSFSNSTPLRSPTQGMPVPAPPMGDHESPHALTDFSGHSSDTHHERHFTSEGELHKKEAFFGGALDKLKSKSHEMKEEHNKKYGLPSCFTGDNTVVEKHKGLVKMSELEVGDEVMCIIDDTLTYSEVTSWLHREPEFEWQPGTCIEINAQDDERGDEEEEGSSVLRLSADHLLFTQDRGPVAAKNIRPGDLIRKTFGNPVLPTAHWVQVELIRRLPDRETYPQLAGLYAPLTKSGTLIVSGVHCSCYAPPEPLVNKAWRTCGPTDVHDQCHWAVQPMNWMPQWMSGKLQEDGGLHPYARVLSDIADTVLSAGDRCSCVGPSRRVST
ncbi:hypothetical protein FOL47_008726 [Perkinsus chesapeaki]|uniref:Hint domain-containing protein n=1 Tax=Perkinsus chesapeaki TaxID=330153 RepID=A0A7J6LC57_PERCH|nr:hypothetical protein FOL47_008726 [Perkinsus chesapeaki]